jgi:hypothetical protein
MIVSDHDVGVGYMVEGGRTLGKRVEGDKLACDWRLLKSTLMLVCDCSERGLSV